MSVSVRWVGVSGISSYEGCLFVLWRLVERRMLVAGLVDR